MALSSKLCLIFAVVVAAGQGQHQANASSGQVQLLLQVRHQVQSSRFDEIVKMLAVAPLYGGHLGFLMRGSQDIHLRPLHKDIPNQDVLSGVLWINGLDRRLRIYRHPDSLLTLSSTSAFLGSGHTRHLWIPNHCILKLGFFESALRPNDCHLTYVETVASPYDSGAKSLDYGSIRNRSYVRATIFSTHNFTPTPHGVEATKTNNVSDQLS